MIRPLQTADIAWAADQHVRLMPNSVFALFGPRFLQCFYRGFATSRHAVAFVAESEGTRQAVIASTSDRPGLLRDIKRRSWFTLGFTGAIGALRHRACRRLLLQSGDYPQTGAEMIFITVDPACRGKGVARDLITATLDAFRNRGIDYVQVTIESENSIVKDLLASMGFTVTKTFTFADKQNDLLGKKL